MKSSYDRTVARDLVNADVLIIDTVAIPVMLENKALLRATDQRTERRLAKNQQDGRDYRRKDSVHGVRSLTEKLTHAGPLAWTANAELKRPTGVACSDLLAHGFPLFESGLTIPRAHKPLPIAKHNRDAALKPTK